MIKTHDYQRITAACIKFNQHPRAEMEREKEDGSSSNLREDDLSPRIWFPGLRSPCLKLFGPTGTLEHYLYPFRFTCCNMYLPQCIYVAMVTLSTVYFLMLTHSSVQSEEREMQYAFRYTRIIQKSHL